MSVNVRPAADATESEILGGLSSTVLRQIDFAGARSEWSDELVANPPGPVHPKPDWLVTPWGKGEINELRSEQLRDALARDGVSDGYLALLAEAYEALVRSGERSVAVKLSEMTGRSPDTVKQHLHKVRKAGMLTSIPGKAGGRLTPKAVRAIREWMSGPDDPDAEWDMAERLAAKRIGTAGDQ